MGIEDNIGRPEFLDPEFGDELGIEVDHVGEIPDPDQPVTISREAFHGLATEITEFLGARIMERLNRGENVRHLEVTIGVHTAPEPKKEVTT